jgi:hypothetical protein
MKWKITTPCSILLFLFVLFNLSVIYAQDASEVEVINLTQNTFSSIKIVAVDGSYESIIINDKLEPKIGMLVKSITPGWATLYISLETLATDDTSQEEPLYFVGEFYLTENNCVSLRIDYNDDSGDFFISSESACEYDKLN